MTTVSGQDRTDLREDASPSETEAPQVRISASRLQTARRLRRAIASIGVFVLAWQVGTNLDDWLGVHLPLVADLPDPVSVGTAAFRLVGEPGYWQSWYQTSRRVALGFSAAMCLGIPFGLLLTISRPFRRIMFAPFELLRPIPPLAWVPAAILFWPTQELSVAFVIFLGAFYPVVLNVVDAADSIDRRFVLAARSMGAARATVIRRVIIPAVLPSIVTGSVVGMGITWEVVVAAELISGGGEGGAGGGLGYLIWNAYVGGALDELVVGMISLGVGGYICSGAIRIIGERFMPWR